MKKIINNIKYIRIKDFSAPFIFLLVLFPSILFKLYTYIFNKKIWLIMESENTARDNGYCFFKYLKEEHPEINTWYVIDKKCQDYNKVNEYKNIIQYGSLKHWLYYLSAYRNISSQKSANPNYTFFYIIHVLLGLYKNRVFLQHGITINNGTWLYYKNTKFKFFVCGAKKEFEYIKENFGYPKENLIYTGFARFDNLYNNNVNNKQVLIMPTWRNWLGRETNKFGETTDFKNTDYYKNWDLFLNNRKFIDYIEQENIEVFFYPHANMQKYLNDFKVKSKNIKIIDMKYDIQKALKESSIMITDYSSVFMDFAYMNKPILFFQFDYEEFRKRQYAEGYYDYRDGFGPSFDNEYDLVGSFINVYKNGMDKKYKKRISDFFEIKDQRNCERIFNIIK